MNLAEKLQHLRKEKNLSQEQLADTIGISRQSVSKWESGQAAPDIEKIVRLSELYNVSTDYILKDEVQQQNPVTEEAAPLPIAPKQTLLMQYDFSLLMGVVATICGFVGTVSLWAMSVVFPVVVQNVTVDENGQYMLADMILPGFFPFLEQRGLELLFGLCFTILTAGLIAIYRNAKKRKLHYTN